MIPLAARSAPLAAGAGTAATAAPAWPHLDRALALCVGQREARRVVLDLYPVT
jgi:hypothetical protein